MVLVIRFWNGSLGSRAQGTSVAGYSTSYPKGSLRLYRTGRYVGFEGRQVGFPKAPHYLLLFS